MSVTTKLFLNNTTQAVRLPRDVAFDESVTEVEITVVGEARVITPVGHRIDAFDRDLPVEDGAGAVVVTAGEAELQKRHGVPPGNSIGAVGLA